MPPASDTSTLQSFLCSLLQPIWYNRSFSRKQPRYLNTGVAGITNYGSALFKPPGHGQWATTVEVSNLDSWPCVLVHRRSSTIISVRCYGSFYWQSREVIPSRIYMIVWHVWSESVSLQQSRKHGGVAIIVVTLILPSRSTWTFPEFEDEISG